MYKKDTINASNLLNQITWLINEQCNFHCDYCIQGIVGKKSELKPIDIIRISESLNCLRGEWHFIINGGEPFLEKNFTEICREITKKHYISIITNLSTENVFDFADHIDPGKCRFIHASVHITERKKRDPKLSLFIEKMIYLQDKGFNITAFYVTHPLLFERIKSDIAYLKSNGIQRTSIKIFTGMYNGKYYPSSFNSEQKEFLEGMEAEYPELEILNKSYNFYGQLCLAGQCFF